MTIDEEIAYQREKAKEQRRRIGTLDKEYSERCEKWAEEHEQLAEWLEELKALKNVLNIKCDNLNEALEKGKKIGYNEAIDECLRITTFYKDEWDGIYSVIERIEQLKAGGVNE